MAKIYLSQNCRTIQPLYDLHTQNKKKKREVTIITIGLRKQIHK